MSELRKPFLVLALLAIGLVVLVELGAALFLGGADAGADLRVSAAAMNPPLNLDGAADAQQPPGRAIAYLALWGFFPRGDAAVVLSLLLVLKLAFAALLILAHHRFLRNKGLVALVLTTLGATIAVAFLHGLVPVIVVSIVDAVAAVVIAIIAIAWALVLLIGSIPAVVKAARATTGA